MPNTNKATAHDDIPCCRQFQRQTTATSTHHGEAIELVRAQNAHVGGKRFDELALYKKLVSQLVLQAAIIQNIVADIRHRNRAAHIFPAVDIAKPRPSGFLGVTAREAQQIAASTTQTHP